jgi:hypothetical protein
MLHKQPHQPPQSGTWYLWHLQPAQLAGVRLLALKAAWPWHAFCKASRPAVQGSWQRRPCSEKAAERVGEGGVEWERTGELTSTGMRPVSVSTCLGVNSSRCTLCPSRPYPPSPAHTLGTAVKPVLLTPESVFIACIPIHPASMLGATTGRRCIKSAHSGLRNAEAAPARPLSATNAHEFNLTRLPPVYARLGLLALFLSSASSGASQNSRCHAWQYSILPHVASLLGRARAPQV